MPGGWNAPSGATSTTTLEARDPRARSATAGPMGTAMDDAAMDSATDLLTKRWMGGSVIQRVDLMAAERWEREAIR